MLPIVSFDYDENSKDFKLRGNLPLLDLDKQDFTNLFNAYVLRDRFISEKIFGNIIHDINLDGGDAYLTLTPEYTLNQINKYKFLPSKRNYFFLMLISLNMQLVMIQ